MCVCVCVCAFTMDSQMAEWDFNGDQAVRRYTNLASLIRLETFYTNDGFQLKKFFWPPGTLLTMGVSC